MLSASSPQRKPKSSQRRRRAGFFAGGRCFTDAAHAEREDQDAGEEPGAQCHLPDPTDGILHGGRIERPDPGRPNRNTAVEAAGAISYVVSVVSAEKKLLMVRMTHARSQRIDAEYFEYAGQQQRIERRDPGGGPGMAVERVGIAVAGHERAGNAAHLVAKGEVFSRGAETIRMRQRDIQDAHEKRDPEDGPGRLKSGGIGLSRMGRASRDAILSTEWKCQRVSLDFTLQIAKGRGPTRVVIAVLPAFQYT